MVATQSDDQHIVQKERAALARRIRQLQDAANKRIHQWQLDGFIIVSHPIGAVHYDRIRKSPGPKNGLPYMSGEACIEKNRRSAEFRAAIAARFVSNIQAACVLEISPPLDLQDYLFEFTPYRNDESGDIWAHDGTYEVRLEAGEPDPNKIYQLEYRFRKILHKKTAQGQVAQLYLFTPIFIAIPKNPSYRDNASTQPETIEYDVYFRLTVA